LDYIAEGLDTLKNMAQDINEVHLYRYSFLRLMFWFPLLILLLVHYITGTW